MAMFFLFSGSYGFDVKNTRFCDVRPTCPQNLKINLTISCCHLADKKNVDKCYNASVHAQLGYFSLFNDSCVFDLWHCCCYCFPCFVNFAVLILL